MFVKNLRSAAFALAALVLAPAPALVPAAAHAAAQPDTMTVGTLVLHRCDAGYGGYCGSILRPLDPGGRTPGTLSVGFQWFPRTDQSTAALGTIAAQEGGPGFSTTGSSSGYVPLFRPLRDHRDILLMDKRGTGLSNPLRCPSLQISTSPTPADYARCGARLGPDAYYYASRFAADDLADLLGQLQVPAVDYYGDSYGTFFGQQFARQYPKLIRTLTLDSAYPDGGRFATPWFATEYNTTPRALRTVCARSPACAALPGDPVDRLDRLVASIRRAPISGSAPDASGTLMQVTADPSTLFTLLDFAGNSPIVWRDFDAAARAWFDHADSLPLLRLVAESLDGNGLGGYGAAEFSNGLATSVICSDYPQLFDMRATPSRRQAQYTAALAGERARKPFLYYPFTIDEAIGAPYQPLEIGVCVDWPVPPADAGPALPDTPAPHVPTLVINGELDTITSVTEGQQVARMFGTRYYVVVANAVHETAIADGDVFPSPQGRDLADCAGPIVLAFVQKAKLDIQAGGDTDCAQETAPIRTPAAFVQMAADATLPQPLPGNAAGATQLRIASAALETVGDVIARYFQQGTSHGLGLRGGSFTFHATPTGYRFNLDQLHWTSDLGVTGWIDWNQDTGSITSRISLSGASAGDLDIAWNNRQRLAPATLTGVLDNTRIAATRIAP